MKTLRTILFLGVIAGLAVFSSCEKDEDNNLSYEEGKQALQDLDTQMSNDMDEMMNTEGMEAVSSLNKMDDPFSSKKSERKTQVISNIKAALVPGIDKEILKSSQGEPFNFNDKTGTYTWIDSLARWDVDPTTPSNKIIINFPADSTDMDNNNATLTIHNYEEVPIETYSYTDYYPTKIVADIYVEDTKYVEIDLTASWDAYGDPTSFEATVFLKPFEFIGSMAQESTSASVDFGISYNNEEIFSTGISATFKTDSMNLPKTIDGYLQYRAVKIDAEANVENIETIIKEIESRESEYETEQEALDAINKEIKAKISKDGSKIANIELRTSQGEMVPVLVFNDGTVENAESYFDNFSGKLEEFFNTIGNQLDSNFQPS
jgi:hypothetical protein